MWECIVPENVLCIDKTILIITTNIINHLHSFLQNNCNIDILRDIWIYVRTCAHFFMWMTSAIVTWVYLISKPENKLIKYDTSNDVICVATTTFTFVFTPSSTVFLQDKGMVFTKHKASKWINDYHYFPTASQANVYFITYGLK